MLDYFENTNGVISKYAPNGLKFLHIMEMDKTNVQNNLKSKVLK